MADRTNAEIKRMSEIEPEEIEWLWPGFIALGKISMIMGDPSLGKSLVTLDMAARVTRGLSWPVDNTDSPMGEVLLLSNEDDPADTIRPRLDAAGADVNRVHLLWMIHEEYDSGIGKRFFSLCRDIDQLDKFLTRNPECLLVIIDPISSYLAGVDTSDTIEVRSVLAPLAELARVHNVAIVCVTHLNKSEHRTSLNRMSGSVSFGALARFVFVVVKDSDNPARRLMLQAKNNLAEDIRGLAYSVNAINGFPTVAWENKYVTVSAEEAFSCQNKHKRSDLADAIEWLKEALAAGRMRSIDLSELAKEEGFSVATIRRAKKQIKVIPYKEGYNGETCWWCELPKVLIDQEDAQVQG
jgi:hypothetical protein